MAPVRRFEDLRVWRDARQLAALVDEACLEIARQRNFGLSDQMRRAAVSVLSNISEGFDRRWPRSFRYFLLMAKGSVAELRAQLYLCEDRNYLSKAVTDRLHQLASDVSRMLWGLIQYLDRFLEGKTTKRGTRNAERGTT